MGPRQYEDGGPTGVHVDPPDAPRPVRREGSKIETSERTDPDVVE